MVTRQRVLESVLAIKIISNPDLAKAFGIELSSEGNHPENKNLDNRIYDQSVTSSTEA